MSAPLLLNLSNSLGKSDNMLALASLTFYFSPYLFNKSNNTGARMIDYFYHMTLKCTFEVKIWRARLNILPYIRGVVMDVIA